MEYYLPSCNFRKADPRATERLGRYFLTRKGMSIPDCCRPLQKRLMAGDLFVSDCQSCFGVTRECSPQAETVSLWEYALKDPNFPWPDYGGERITVQDCWRARNDRPQQEAVRACLRRMNMVPVELEDSFDRADFDGLFLYTPVSGAALKLAPRFFSDAVVHVTPLSDEQALEKMRDQVKKYATDRAVCYCNACLKGVLAGGGTGVHLASLLAGRM